jgi:hypothetical protein
VLARDAAARIWFLAVGVVLLVSATGCESSTPPTGGGGLTKPTGGGGLTKPSDPAKAFTDAVGRTAKFKDVKFDTATTEVVSGNLTTTRTATSSTSNPPVIETESTTGGQVTGVVNNLATGILCFPHPAAGQPQTRASQRGTASQTDPFSTFTATTGWQFRPDVDMKGHHDWHLSATPPGNTFGGIIKFSENTVGVFIDATSGRIQTVQIHSVYTNGGPAPLDVTIVDDNFVYDSGVKITPCP